MLDLTVTGVLRAARGFIQTGWTQGRNAADARGDDTAAGSPMAAVWCMTGACDRAAYKDWDGEYGPLTDLRSEVYRSAVHALAKHIPPDPVNLPGMDAPGARVVAWNDANERTKEEVIAVFTIAMAEEERQQRLSLAIPREGR